MAIQTKTIWQKTKIGDFVVFNYGKGLPKRERIPGPYPVYGSAGIVDTNKDYLIEGPGIVVGRKGSVGEIYYSGKNYFPIDTVYYITKDEKYNLRFLYYLLKTIDFKSLNSDVAVPGLNRNTAYAQEVLLPEIETQKRIADVLSAYDDLIENNTRRIKILEQIAQATYREWFVNFRFPGHEEVKMVDSKTEFGEIPEGWEVRKIKDLGEIITGKTPPKKDLDNFGVEIPFIKIPDLHNQTFCIETEESLSDKGANIQKNKMLPPCTLIVSCIGTLGVVAITSKESQTNQQINAIVLAGQKYLEYGYFLLIDLKQTLQNIGANGATMGNVNKTKFESIDILWPSETAISKYHEQVGEIFSGILNLQKQNQNLRHARDLLLPKLVTGEIRV